MREDAIKGGRQTKPEASVLSAREREVITLVAQGLSNKEASARLGLSVRTIEKHRERIMKRLGLHGAVEMTKYAVAHGLVDRPTDTT